VKRKHAIESLLARILLLQGADYDPRSVNYELAPLSLVPLSFCSLPLAPVSAITSNPPSPCYISFTPGEIREFGV
jgi:hypothetical protein